MSLEDAFKTKPAVHISNGVTGVKCAKRQNGPCLNCDHIITSRSKSTRRRRIGGLVKLLEAVSHLSETHRAHPSDVKVNFTHRQAWGKERQGASQRGGEGALQHSSRSGLKTVSQREGFQQSASRVICQTLPTPETALHYLSGRGC